jgi:hypothetical protein
LTEMKASIVITDDAGRTWEYELTPVHRAGRARVVARPRETAKPFASAKKVSRPQRGPDIDFSLPVRPFIKRYASGASGPRKFAILVARLAAGDTGIEIPFKDIEKQWNKMTQLMGGRFNPSHASRAKDAGWVDSPKHGVYKLLGDWGGALIA